MSRYLLMLSLTFFINSFCNAQSYLGKSRKEIYTLSKSDFENPKISFNNDSEDTYLKIINGYETLYYYLENDVCVKFVVYKPYSCDCLETDLNTYESALIPNGDLKWMSQDLLKKYEMSLFGRNYSLTILPNEAYTFSSNRE